MVLNALVRSDHGVDVFEIAIFVARDRDKYERELVLSRRRLEDAVKEATRLQVEAKDRAVFAEQMMGIVSHDLRNPLSTIQMATVLLGRGDLPASQQRVLSRITRAAERANKLIADLLDFTQARLGRGLPVKRETIDLHSLAGETVEELSLAYPGRTLRHDRCGDGTCWADPHRLAQLIGNLVANAITYGSPGSPVTVTSSIDVNTFSLGVHNQGTPIPPELQSGLFHPMARGSTAASATRSVGLGLFIVKEITRAHGGDVAVDSTAENGTTFRATFPCREVA
jgi:phosphoserine phosphatase RsbU/P